MIDRGENISRWRSITNICVAQVCTNRACTFGRELFDGFQEGGNRTNSLVPSNIEISNSLRVPFFPCATFESRFDALAFPGPMRRDRARCSVQDEEKDQHHHAQGTWQERRRPRWYLCSRVYVSIPFARTSSSSWRYVLGVYEYYPSLLPSRSLFVPRGSTAARTRATTSSN